MSDEKNKKDLENIDELESIADFDEYDEDLKALSEEESEEGGEEILFEEDEYDHDNAELDAPKKPEKKPFLNKNTFILGAGALAISGFAAFSFLPMLTQGDSTSSPERVVKSEPVKAPIELLDNDDFVDDKEIVLAKNNVSEEAFSKDKDSKLKINLGNLSETSKTTDIKKDIFEVASVKNEDSKSNVLYQTDPKLLALIDDINSKLTSLESKISSVSKKDSVKIKYVDKIVEVEVEKKVKRMSDAEVSSLLKGRSRLNGYSVINTSRDGTMAIVKTDKPDKQRVSVFFKGESIYLTGIGKQTISSIEDNGFIALVGSKWFIDEDFEKVIAKAKTETKKKASKPKAKDKSESKKVKSVTNGVLNPTKADPNVVITTPLKEVEKFYKVADGWLLNGVYTGTYLIETPTGEWIKKRDGDTLTGLGIIKGLDKSGSLIAGDYLIKLADYK